MTLDQANRQIAARIAEMNDRYGSTVFDEWAILSLGEHKARILAYSGPRNDAFLKNFADDLGALRAELLEPKYAAGDFEFARHATGTRFEAFMVLGDGIYLICNHTQSSMNQIANDPRWLQAQVPFAELGDRFRADPVEVAL